jgi:ubiquinone/menaquinone biosynthesis C-methylase UbiE
MERVREFTLPHSLKSTNLLILSPSRKGRAMALNKEQLRNLYRKRAARYDLSANLYYLIGFRENFYRKKAVAALSLKRGDTVVEIGCGTGLNFAFLQNAIGETGKLVGVDLTDAMLDKARQRIDRNGWRNVNLVRIDAAEYEFPKNIKGWFRHSL